MVNKSTGINKGHNNRTGPQAKGSQSMNSNRRHPAHTSRIHPRPRGETAEAEYEYTWW